MSVRSNTTIQVEPAYIETLKIEYPVPTGTLLQKLEIIIQFFQVYCIILWLSSNNNLQWPQTWKDIKSGYDWPPYLLTVDVQSTYALQGVQVSSLYQEVFMCTQATHGICT